MMVILLMLILAILMIGGTAAIDTDMAITCTVFFAALAFVTFYEDRE